MKVILGVLVLVALLAITVVPVYGDSKSIRTPGDANGNGKINMADVTKVERIILGYDAVTAGADANGDGLINMADVIGIERYILGLDRGDCNRDGRLSIVDLTKLERVLADFDRPNYNCDINRDGWINNLDREAMTNVLLR